MEGEAAAQWKVILMKTRTLLLLLAVGLLCVPVALAGHFGAVDVKLAPEVPVVRGKDILLRINTSAQDLDGTYQWCSSTCTTPKPLEVYYGTTSAYEAEVRVPLDAEDSMELKLALELYDSSGDLHETQTASVHVKTGGGWSFGGHTGLAEQAWAWLSGGEGVLKQVGAWLMAAVPVVFIVGIIMWTKRRNYTA